MTHIYPYTFLNNNIQATDDAKVHIASSAVLYGLSIYTVFPVVYLRDVVYAFRLVDHYNRLVNSAKIIGIDTFESEWSFEKFSTVVSDLIEKNKIKNNSFVRATVHVVEQLAGTRSRGLDTSLSIFIYEAQPIIPQNGARVKTSVWRRVPDYAIPSRAKVNGTYVNSVLGKQDAIDSGYDDCVFLDAQGHVCELSAANIFLIKNKTLITPPTSADILEGITRKTIIEIAYQNNILVEERMIDLTELYTADAIFACGTSSSVAPIIEIDKRLINSFDNSIMQTIQSAYTNLFKGEGDFEKYFTKI